MKTRIKDKQERRKRIHQAWEESFDDLFQGETTLGEILGYDDQRMMRLAGKGLRLFRAGHYPKARKIFSGLVVLDPWVGYFHYLLGMVTEQLGEFSIAQREYHLAMELLQELEPIPEVVGFSLLGKARVLGRLGDYVTALALLEKLTPEAYPNNDAALHQTAQLIGQHFRQAAQHAVAPGAKA